VIKHVCNYLENKTCHCKKIDSLYLINQLCYHYICVCVCVCVFRDIVLSCLKMKHMKNVLFCCIKKFIIKCIASKDLYTHIMSICVKDLNR
jgi:hypothetical protein